MRQRIRWSYLSVCASLCVTVLGFGCGGPVEGSPDTGDAPLSPSPALPSPEAPAAPGTSQPAPAPGTESPTSTEPAPAPPQPSATIPSDLLDLRAWKLTLPIDTSAPGKPDEIHQPALATYTHDEYFRLTPEKDGVVFRAPVQGATTSGSGYPRSELREMTADGRDLASWSTTKGKHTMVIREAITHLPEVKDEVVAGQIHDSSSDLIEIRLEGKHLFVAADGPNVGTLDPDYTLGTIFTVKIEAADGHVKVYYNDVLKVDIARSSPSNYFKAGMYTQSNLSKGDAEGAYGEAIIYDVKVTHEG